MVDENDKFHEPCLKVLKGELRRTTVVNVSYQDGNATGEYTTVYVIKNYTLFNAWFL